MSFAVQKVVTQHQAGHRPIPQAMLIKYPDKYIQNQASMDEVDNIE